MNEHIIQETFMKIIEMSNGNPGVVRVLSEISKQNAAILNPLHIMIKLTKTKSSLLWIVYKDICEFDINKTIKYLEDWYSNTSVNLNEYIKTNNPEARHFYDE